MKIEQYKKVKKLVKIVLTIVIVSSISLWPIAKYADYELDREAASAESCLKRVEVPLVGDCYRLLENSLHWREWFKYSTDEFNEFIKVESLCSEKRCDCYEKYHSAHPFRTFFYNIASPIEYFLEKILEKLKTKTK